MVRRLAACAASAHVKLRERLVRFAARGIDYPVFSVLVGTPAPDKLSVLVSAGIHGDEPAGVEAALQFVEHN